MQQLVLDIEESHFPVLLHFLETLDFVRIVLPETKHSTLLVGQNLPETASVQTAHSDFPPKFAKEITSTGIIIDWENYLKGKDLSKYKTGFGGAKGMFVMSSDFDEPLEDLKEYMY